MLIMGRSPRWIGRRVIDRAAPSGRYLCAATLVLACLIGGCASLPAGSLRDPRDHVERFNRAMFHFDTALDHAVMRPVARRYVKVAPSAVRTGVYHFLSNLSYTQTIVNDLLQGQLKDFGADVARLVIDTTVGVGGFLDPASHLGLHPHDRDFGQTLGKWGLHTGSYLVLPLLGPSDVRDALGYLPDRFMSIDGYLDGADLNVSLLSMRTTTTRAEALPTDSTVSSAYDPYAFVRSAWFQRRAYKVHGENPNDLPSLPPLDLESGR